MIIRNATMSDLGQLSILFDAYRVFYQKESDHQRALSFLSQRMENKDSVIYVAIIGECLVGFVQLYPLFSSIRMNRLWLLNDLYVSEPYRGRKISAKFIERAKQLALETDAAGLTLETARLNTIANNLYLTTGFLLDQEHHFYAWEPEQPVQKCSLEHLRFYNPVRLWI